MQIVKYLVAPRKRSTNRSAMVVVLIAASTLVGCNGPGNGRVPVTGTVTVDGKLLAFGNVIFMDRTTGAADGVGAIHDGKYSVRETASREGMRPGNYQVRIESWIEAPGEFLPDGRISKGVANIPRIYMNPKTSGLTAEVPDRGATIDFDLSSAGSNEAKR